MGIAIAEFPGRRGFRDETSIRQGESAGNLHRGIRRKCLEMM